MIIMANFGPTWVIGKKNENSIDDPRAYVFNGKQHAIMNLPGMPSGVVRLDKAYFWYEIPPSEVVDLYLQQVSNIEVQKPKILMPN